VTAVVFRPFARAVVNLERRYTSWGEASSTNAFSMKGRESGGAGGGFENHSHTTTRWGL
jgi:hypothetical protein